MTADWVVSSLPDEALKPGSIIGRFHLNPQLGPGDECHAASGARDVDVSLRVLAVTPHPYTF
jgi:hypothetical protein